MSRTTQKEEGDGEVGCLGQHRRKRGWGGWVSRTKQKEGGGGGVSRTTQRLSLNREK